MNKMNLLMKKKPKVILSAAVLIVAVLFTGAVSGIDFMAGDDPESLTGTWQLSSYKYGISNPSFIDVPQTRRRVKIINESHFTWVEFDASSGKVTQSAGGIYTLDGDTYTESIDFGLGMDSYIGSKHDFTYKVIGDILFISGSLSDELKIEEIWQRVK